MDFGRTMKYQREAEPDWPHQLKQLPGCERLFSCIQCGKCSGTCPLSIYMDYTPRRIINLVREGFRNEALSSKTIWLCASCYACAVHCPQDIHITDVMYMLKREAIQHQMYPKRFPIPVLAREFYDLVRKRGRSSEFWLVLRLAMKSNPLILLGMVRTGFWLIRTGRLSLRSERIRGVHQLRRELATPKEAQ
ncbi:MAG: 4Fe-4S dicluster domain-containing protein [Bryobacterales bacterium]|nr:4Fe-4S dicluster domain-containing protein [Bryobacterales bacterium]